MKIENIEYVASSDDETTLALLLHRIGDELYDMSITCRNVEDALGIVIAPSLKQIDQPIVALQGLDRLRQTVEDLARLTRAIARGQALSSIYIPTHDINKAVVLNGLEMRLTGAKTNHLDDAQEDQDVIWK